MGMGGSLERVVEFSQVSSIEFDMNITGIVNEGNRKHLVMFDNILQRGAHVILEDDKEVFRKDFDFCVFGLARDGNRTYIGALPNKNGSLLVLEDGEEISRTEYKESIGGIAVFGNKRYLGLVDDSTESCFLSIEEDGKELSRTSLD
ncbi:hypothetical protein KY325_05090, partial [Candidatus Woesearchaeota archaeon]|nr:hypothetical protein [Candidatus Woesearchaeota archaeon]